MVSACGNTRIIKIPKIITEFVVVMAIALALSMNRDFAARVENIFRRVDEVLPTSFKIG